MKREEDKDQNLSVNFELSPKIRTDFTEAAASDGVGRLQARTG